MVRTAQPAKLILVSHTKVFERSWMSYPVKSFFLFLFFILNGCIFHPVIGPGYAYNIELNADVILKDTDFLENIIQSEKFGRKRTSISSPATECMAYVKEDSLIQIVYCYDKEQNVGEKTQIVKNFGISIFDNWRGQEQEIKQEINRIGHIISENMASRFGKDKIQIKNRRTGPPF